MTPASLDTAREALGFVSPVDRKIWVRMGMALKSEFGEPAKDIWMDWSQGSDDFNLKAAQSSWRTFKPGKVGIGSLFYEAQAEGFKFDHTGAEVSPEKLAADRLERAERAAKDEAARQERAAAASVRALAQWRMAARDGDSPYLVRKLVLAEACRYLGGGAIFLPMMRYDGQPRMVGKQVIAANGEKRYSGGMDKNGAACRLGTQPTDGDDIGIGEGYATCLTIRMATEQALTVYAAFDSGNLRHVAAILRGLYPSSRLIFFADDDYLTGGAGLAEAQASAAAVGNALVIMPTFTAARRQTKKDESLPKLTDFNDLHVAESLDAVKAQLAPRLAAAPSNAAVVGDDNAPCTVGYDESVAAPAPPSQDDVVGIAPPTAEQLISHFALIYPTTDIWDGLRRQRMKRSAFTAWVGKAAVAEWDKNPKRRSIMRESLPALVGGRAMAGGAGGSKLDEMLEHLTLLRGTETVWDGIGQQVMTLGAVRADYTADLTGKWQEHALRKTIEARNLVFDPTQQADPVAAVNIFLGWPLTPQANVDLVMPILALLESLCSAEDNVDECVTWILRWLAYPLQHPGAKMQTALLMFGEKQGTGKSLFFQDVVAPIYGDYGTIASQHQLDSSFTAWRSRKLFVLFEEVLSRDDKYSHNGTLKYMITGKQMSINQKNLPERTERNHMNGVFLSNEPQPIPIELEDRRFMVIEARAKQAQEFYDQVSASIAVGGIEAFYHFLLEFPLDGFNEHTKPMMTLAKERVIEFGLNGWMSFHRSWKDGYLAAPYCSCLSEDLFKIYRRWCEKTGEKPLTLCKFAGLLASREHKVKRSVCVGAKGKTTRMIFEVKAEGEGESVDKQIERFRRLGDIRGDGVTDEPG